MYFVKLFVNFIKSDKFKKFMNFKKSSHIWNNSLILKIVQK